MRTSGDDARGVFSFVLGSMGSIDVGVAPSLMAFAGEGVGALDEDMLIESCGKWLGCVVEKQVSLGTATKGGDERDKIVRLLKGLRHSQLPRGRLLRLDLKEVGLNLGKIKSEIKSDECQD